MGAVPFDTALYQERHGPDQSSHHHHGMEPDKTPLEEASRGHLAPPSVVGVAYHEAGEDEEEIHCQVAVGDGSAGMEFEHMIDDDDQGCDSAEAVKNVVMGAGIL